MNLQLFCTVQPLFSFLHFCHLSLSLSLQQCMPEGVQLSKEPSHHFSFHSLLITRENGSRQYGSVLTYHEPVTNPLILDALESHQNEYQSHSRGGSDLSQYWYFNRSSDALYATKCLCFITSLPIFQPTRSYLEQLYAISVGNDRGSLPIESYLYNLLYETSLPGPGVMLKLHGPLDLITWRLPGNEELPLCDYSFRAFFESISLKNILQLLTCVLLEQQILLKANGKRIRVYTYCMYMYFAFMMLYITIMAIVSITM